MDLKKAAYPAAVGVVLLALFAAWLWQPERQVRLHQKHFLQAVERRNWAKMERLMAADYGDRWGHDKSFVIGAVREVFGQFLFLTIEQRTDECLVADTSATVQTTVRISGNGGPAAQYAMSAVNALREPFVFTWKRSGSWPWEWGLARVEHRQLDLDRLPSF